MKSFLFRNFAFILALVLISSKTCAETAQSEPGQKSVRLHFSAQPSELEIFAVRVFDEPLIPMGGKPTAAENKALADALAEYSNRTNVDDFSSLTGFLSRFPNSPWSDSLLLHLGTEYYNFGYYSKAVDAWERAWKNCQHIDDPKAKPQADRALGELARMYSKLGRMRELEGLLNSISNRPLTGPGTQLIHNAKQALWKMQHQPGVSFRCGPLALEQILAEKDPKQAVNPLVIQSQSTPNGCSLPQVAALSAQLGMNYQMAFRASNATLIVPSVIHWKVGHYAALLRQDGDQFLLKDHTFHSSLLMTRAALEAEASGYFLVPSGPLPAGWRSVPEQEGALIWGKGIRGSDPDGTGPNDAGGPGGCGGGGSDGGGGGASAGGGCGDGGMTTYSMHLMLASLTLTDMPVGYSPPLGPVVYFIATYNQLEANQPATFSYSNLGSKWNFNWISYITDNPRNPGADVSLYQSGGGTITYKVTLFGSQVQSYALEQMSQTVLVATKFDSTFYNPALQQFFSAPSTYEQRFQDGSKRIFTAPGDASGTSRRIFMTQLVDPAGNAVNINYDSFQRVTNVTDAIGQSTTFFYTNTDFPYAITAVQDPFGRVANFFYNSTGHLIQITDVLGIASQYTYSSNDFISALTTPYGTTTFSGGLTNGTTWIQATDPLGETELLESVLDTSVAVISPAEPAAIVPIGMSTYNGSLNVRNSFFWGKKAFEDGALAYTNATVYHFLLIGDIDIESRMLESMKKPLENRVWYNYSGNSAPNMLGSGIINEPSVVGRVLDDGTSQLYFYGYNAAGKVTNSVDPAGRTFTYTYASNNLDLLETRMTRNGKNELLGSATYSAQHRPLTLTDASGQTTTNNYNAQGQIVATSAPSGATTTFSYGTNGYLLSITGPLQTTNDTVSFTYDAFGRVQTVTDTEGYTLTYNYDAMDRVTKISFPDGTFQQAIYSNLDLVASCDRLSRWTTNTYNADRQLIGTRDPLGRLTQFEWCHCGAMTGLIDPMGRETTWDYDIESRPIAKHYVDGSTIYYAYENTTSRLASRLDEQRQQTVYQYNIDDTLAIINYPNAVVPTPTVTYFYDTDYNRVLTMQDGIGLTTYTYNSITPAPTLGAGRLASVSGPLPNSTVTYQYDQLGRVINRAINGVAQAVTYDLLGRPITVTNALGSFTYGYVDATSRPASEAYPNGQTNLYSYYNNLGDQRLLQIQHLYPNGSLLSACGYAYNAVGQITAWTNQWDTLPTRVWLSQYDAADQLTNVASAGGPSAVTNYAYAYDFAGNRTLNQTNVTANQSTYNALNQLSGAKPGFTNSATYEWDAENRLTAINQGTNRSEFVYDGLGRRIEIVEKTNGVVMTNNYYLWCGNRICETRDSTGDTVLRRLLPQGESLGLSAGSSNYFYTRDHLSSVREAIDLNGSIATRLDYDPYGQRIGIQQPSKVSCGYSGDYVHSPSALCLTPNRLLSPLFGRFLSRDPLQEQQGGNLYQYVGNNPLNLIDPSGLGPNKQQCTALNNLVNYSDNHVPFEVITSEPYGWLLASMGRGSQLNENLDAAFNTIVGPVSPAWMLHSAIGGPLPGMTYGAYIPQKIVNNLLSGASPFAQLFSGYLNKNINAPAAASLWLNGIPLQVIFGPALQQCGVYNNTSGSTGPGTSGGGGGSSPGHPCSGQ